MDHDLPEDLAEQLVRVYQLQKLIERVAMRERRVETYLESAEYRWRYHHRSQLNEIYGKRLNRWVVRFGVLNNLRNKLSEQHTSETEILDIVIIFGATNSEIIDQYIEGLRAKLATVTERDVIDLYRREIMQQNNGQFASTAAMLASLI